LKTYALFQVISPKSNSAITWFMDYGGWSKIIEAGMTLLPGKSHCPRTIKWQDLPTDLRYLFCSIAVCDILITAGADCCF
jgi:hypothetical protein